MKRLQVPLYAHAVGLVLVVFVDAAAAQTATSETPPSAQSLAPVVITATRSPRPLADLPMSASVVTSEQIENTPALSLDDVLRHVAGVNLPIQTGIQAHPTADNVSMRGLGGIHALVMVDGVPINDPFFGYVQWGRIPMENIDRIEIVRGGGSPLWGNYAMGGTINVITRTADHDTAIVDAGLGNYTTYRSNLFASYGVASSHRLSLDVNLAGTQGFMAVPDYARRPFDRSTTFAAQNYSLGDHFKPSADLSADFNVTHHENDQRLGTVLSTNNQQTTNYVGNLRKTFGSRSTLTATLFHGDSRFVTNNSIVTDPSLPLDQQQEHLDNVHTTPVHDTGGSIVLSHDLSSVMRNVTVGADFHWIDGSDTAAIFDSSGTTQVRTDVGSGKERFTGVFAQASFAPVDRLEILASGRLQRFEVLDGFDGNPGGSGPQPDRNYTSFDPRISVRWAQTEKVALRAAWYKSFRAPTLDNLYRGFASNGGIYYPNSQLKPETLHGGEIGLDVVDKDVRAQFTLYRTELANLITTANLDPAQLPPGFFYGGRLVNAASARAQGFEAQVDWRIASGLSSTLAYTYADSRYLSNPEDPGSVGQQLQDVPRTTASAALTYQGGKGWSLSTTARWISETAWASADHTNPGFPYQAAADPHLVVDVAGRYPIRPNIEAYLQIQNLLNRRYIVNPGPYNPPLYGTPFEALVGIRVILE